MKFFLISITVLGFVASFISAKVMFDKLDIKILDPSKGTAEIRILPTKPRTVDVDVNSHIDAKDIVMRLGAFSQIDGKYNEIIETETFSLCNMGKSENVLIGFVYKEMSKAGNLTDACPIHKGYYHLKSFGLAEEDVPITLPQGNFKVELNGTLHLQDGTDHPIFVCDIYFKEV